MVEIGLGDTSVGIHLFYITCVYILLIFKDSIIHFCPHSSVCGIILTICTSAHVICRPIREHSKACMLQFYILGFRLGFSDLNLVNSITVLTLLFTYVATPTGHIMLWTAIHILTSFDILAKSIYSSLTNNNVKTLLFVKELYYLAMVCNYWETRGQTVTSTAKFNFVYLAPEL